MVIEINKDIDRYRESVVMGLGAKQLAFSVAAVAGGGGIVLALYGHIGLTASVYVAIPVVAPIALEGFYDFNGMGFLEVMSKKMKMAFSNRALVYVSTESGDAIRKWRAGEAMKAKKQKKQHKAAAGKAPRKGRLKEFHSFNRKFVPAAQSLQVTERQG